MQSSPTPSTAKAAPATSSFGVRFAPKEVNVQRRPDGSILLQSPIALTGCGNNIVDYLEQWAADAPDRVFWPSAQPAAAGRHWTTRRPGSRCGRWRKRCSMPG